jgi:predicted dehydrogenase
LRLECQHFAKCVLEGKRPLTDGYNGLRVVEVIEAAQRSLQEGGTPVAVQTDTVICLNGHDPLVTEAELSA